MTMLLTGCVSREFTSLTDSPVVEVPTAVVIAGEEMTCEWEVSQLTEEICAPLLLEIYAATDWQTPEYQELISMQRQGCMAVAINMVQHAKAMFPSYCKD